MKAKVIRGKSFRGVLRYILDEGPNQKGKKPQIVSGNIVGSNSRELTQEFQAIRSLRPDIDKAVLHIPLSAAPGEHLADGQWDEIIQEHQKNMGLEGFPYFAARHQDTGNDHVHVITCRINEDAEVWLGQWEAKIAIESTQQIEKKFGLIQTKGLEKSPKNRPFSPEINKAVRTSNEPPRMKLQRLIDEALSQKPTGKEFLELLETAGVEVKTNVNSKGVNGLSFAIDGLAFSGSKLGADYKWSSLLKRGLYYEQNGDFAEFTRRRAVREDAGVSVENGQKRARTERVEDVDAATSEGTNNANELLFNEHDQVRQGNQPTNLANNTSTHEDKTVMDRNFTLSSACALNISLSVNIYTKHSHPGFVDPELAITRIRLEPSPNLQPEQKHQRPSPMDAAAVGLAVEAMMRRKETLSGLLELICWFFGNWKDRMISPPPECGRPIEPSNSWGWLSCDSPFHF